jgi:hypothetical protein
MGPVYSGSEKAGIIKDLLGPKLKEGLEDLLIIFKKYSKR